MFAEARPPTAHLNHQRTVTNPDFRERWSAERPREELDTINEVQRIIQLNFESSDFDLVSVRKIAS